MKKDFLLYFLYETGNKPKGQPRGMTGLLYFPLLQSLKAGENKNNYFFSREILIKTSNNLLVYFLLSVAYECIWALLANKKPDRGIKMSLQYIGNVYRFVKSISLTTL